jgi:hypothetical protein
MKHACVEDEAADQMSTPQRPVGGGGIHAALQVGGTGAAWWGEAMRTQAYRVQSAL